MQAGAHCLRHLLSSCHAHTKKYKLQTSSVATAHAALSLWSDPWRLTCVQLPSHLPLSWHLEQSVKVTSPLLGQTVWVLPAILLILGMLTILWQVRHPPSQEDLSPTELDCICLDSSSVSCFWSSSSLPPAKMPSSLPRNSRRWCHCQSNINPGLQSGGTLGCSHLEAVLYNVPPCTPSSREEKTSTQAALAIPGIDTIRCSLLCHILVPKVEFSCGKHFSVYPTSPWKTELRQYCLWLQTIIYCCFSWYFQAAFQLSQQGLEVPVISFIGRNRYRQRRQANF